MKTIMKYILGAFAFYCIVNWIADNPETIDNLRNKLNDFVGVGVEKTKEVVKENTP